MNKPKQQTIEQQIKEATTDVSNAMLAHVTASKAVVNAQLEQGNAKFLMRKAEERLTNLKWELLS